MRFPCELILDSYISQLRVSAAIYLKNNNFSQSKIAELLQVSQPVISGYLKSRKETNTDHSVIIEEAVKIGEKLGEILALKGVDGITEAIALGCNSCKVLRQGGATCMYHKSIVPFLNDNCNSCHTKNELIQLQIDREYVLKELREMFSILSAYRNFNTIIPEIGLQIVYGTSNIQNISDIAGFPGRIKKKKGGTQVAEIPSFGSSETLSMLLLRIRSYIPRINALAGIKTSDWLIEKLNEAGIMYVEIEEFDKKQEIKLPELAKYDSQSIKVIIDWGSKGFEAISYVLGESAEELQTILVQLL